MKILVTGGTGFLGSHLISELEARGHQVYGLSRVAPAMSKTPWIEHDLSTVEGLAKKLEGFEVIFHTASKVGMWGDYQDFHRINILGTENLLAIAKELGIKKFIYTSTPSVVFGRDHLLGVDESTPYPKKFLTYYAKTKAHAEQLVLKANNDEGLITTALRPHLIFGERDPHLLPRMKDAAHKKRIKIIGDGSNLIDVIYIDNAVEAHLLAMEALGPQSKNAGKAYFIAQENPVNCWQFINTLLKLHGIAPLTKSVPLPFAYILGALIEFIFTVGNIKKWEPPMTRFIALQLGKSHFFNTHAAQRDFGYSPRYTIPQALERMRIANNTSRTTNDRS